MEKFNDGDICPLTGWEVSNCNVNSYLYTYVVKNDDVQRLIWVSSECFEDQIFDKSIIRWLLFKNKIPSINSSQDSINPTKNLITNKLLKGIVSELFIPKTPKEKFDQFFLDLSLMFPNYQGSIFEKQLLNFTLFRSETELRLFLDYLQSKNFIDYSNVGYVEERKRGGNISHSKGNYVIRLKFDGLNYLANLEISGKKSNKCFIAMSFSESDKISNIKIAIKKALIETHFQPILINEIHYASHVTINDAIIAEIKKSKFMVADFTEQKDGVYFEAGFALGLGLPVIYCCHKDDFEKSHFDLNHYPHIIYGTSEELTEGLKNKIEAWID